MWIEKSVRSVCLNSFLQLFSARAAYAMKSDLQSASKFRSVCDNQPRRACWKPKADISMRKENLPAGFLYEGEIQLKLINEH